jgi:hypothetical protein
MAWFKYIGDPRLGGEGPPRIALFGYSFERAIAVEVTDAATSVKLAGNRHFAMADGAAKDEGAPAREPRSKPKSRARRKTGVAGAA